MPRGAPACRWQSRSPSKPTASLPRLSPWLGHPRRRRSHQRLAVAYYMVDCTHPLAFRASARSREHRCAGCRGIRANASCLSHARLRTSATDSTRATPLALLAAYVALRQRLPQLTVLGGCYSSDHRHMGADARRRATTTRIRTARWSRPGAEGARCDRIDRYAPECGDRLPDATFRTLTPEGVKTLTTAEVFGGRKVVLFAVPAAFSPTCSQTHLPGYVDGSRCHQGRWRRRDRVRVRQRRVGARRLGRAAGREGRVLMLSDGNLEFTRAAGMELTDGRRRGVPQPALRGRRPGRRRHGDQGGREAVARRGVVGESICSL